MAAKFEQTLATEIDNFLETSSTTDSSETGREIGFPAACLGVGGHPFAGNTE